MSYTCSARVLIWILIEPEKASIRKYSVNGYTRIISGIRT